MMLLLASCSLLVMWSAILDISGICFLPFRSLFVIDIFSKVQIYWLFGGFVYPKRSRNKAPQIALLLFRVAVPVDG
jgi:hypothetical protein